MACLVPFGFVEVVGAGVVAGVEVLEPPRPPRPPPLFRGPPLPRDWVPLPLPMAAVSASGCSDWIAATDGLGLGSEELFDAHTWSAFANTDLHVSLENVISDMWFRITIGICSLNMAHTVLEQ